MPIFGAGYAGQRVFCRKTRRTKSCMNSTGFRDIGSHAPPVPWKLKIREADMLGGLRNKITAEELRPDREPVVFPAVVARSKSRRVAEAEEHVENLEATVEEQKTEIARLNGRLTLVEESNAILHEQVAKAEHDRDYYRDRCTMIVAKLNSSAAIILDAVREPIPASPPTSGNINTDAIAATFGADNRQEG